MRNEYDAHRALKDGAAAPPRSYPKPRRRLSLRTVLIWLGLALCVAGLYATSDCQSGVRCTDN